jgi:hypothetical protein
VQNGPRRPNCTPPIERAKAALRDNPAASARQIAKEAKVSVRTAKSARKDRKKPTRPAKVETAFAPVNVERPAERGADDSVISVEHVKAEAAELDGINELILRAHDYGEGAYDYIDARASELTSDGVRAEAIGMVEEAAAAWAKVADHLRGLKG